MKTITRPLRTIQGRPQPAPGTDAADLLTFLAAEPRQLESLLIETGLQTSDLPALRHDRALLDGVIDWLLASDDRILAMATLFGRAPDKVAIELARLRSRS